MPGWPYTTTTWKKLRRAKLARNPLCEMCSRRGDLVPAYAVDHVTPVSAGGHPFPALDSLMALCQRCHSEKTAAFDRPGGNVTGRRFKGADADGNPIDPADGWHR